ncbi:Hexose carrier protein HEX6 [Linum perenne]
MHGGSSTILTVGALFLPETPSSVIQRTKNQEKARKVLEKIRGTSEIELELDDLTLASQISISIHNPFRTILPLSFRSMEESTSLMSAVLNDAIEILTTFLSMLTVDRNERQKLFFIDGVQMFVSQILVGEIMAAELGDHNEIGKQYAMVVIVLIINYVARFGLS